MSTTEQSSAIPTGTWQADTVHSSVAFEVPYAVASFRGTVGDFEATLADGRTVSLTRRDGAPPPTPGMRIARRRATRR